MQRHRKKNKRLADTGRRTEAERQRESHFGKKSVKETHAASFAREMEPKRLMALIVRWNQCQVKRACLLHHDLARLKICGLDVHLDFVILSG